MIHLLEGFMQLRKLARYLLWPKQLRKRNLFLFSVLVTSLLLNYYYIMKLRSCKSTVQPATSIKPKKENQFNDDFMQFLVNNEKICSDFPVENLLLMMVSSARYNFELRQAIRETWGSVLQHDVIDSENGTVTTWHVRLIFIVGLPLISEGPYHKRNLAEESRNFGDIIMGNFSDIYRHLSYKHLLGYKWAINYCPTAKFILKVDDDVFVNMYQVLQVLHQVGNRYKSAFYCSKNVGQPAVRYEYFKTRVTVEEWPDAEFPPYCTGFGYLAKTSVISKLYDLRHQAPFLYVEDVFVTGVLREAHNRKVTRKNPNYIHIRNLEHRIKLYEDPKILPDETWTSSMMITGILHRKIAIRGICHMWKLNLREYYMSPEGKALVVLANHRSLICPSTENQ